ncbi:hypothetical protein [Clostridium sp. C2-6-12]|uniref:hypothetical protein n=1 Tax=Clostridium sp. C2-6-12 TaxID=2698832 RepID=UPI00136D8455|nr:hypothetical protein [Clostridium sp. C2-6-12]
MVLLSSLLIILSMLGGFVCFALLIIKLFKKNFRLSLKQILTIWLLCIVVFIGSFVVYSAVYKPINKNNTESSITVRSEDKKIEEKSNINEQSKNEVEQKKLDDYVQLLESGKTYEDMTPQERTTISELLKTWEEQDSDFQSKYKDKKDFVENSMNEAIAKLKTNKESEIDNKKSDEMQAVSNEDNIPKAVTSNYTAKFGKILEANKLNNKLTIKFKIKPSATNKLTIDQNGFNVEDLITSQGADKYDEINYWAVADMTDGSESKVISYTLNKDLIQKIKDKKVFGQQIDDLASNVWILPSLKK